MIIQTLMYEFQVANLFQLFLNVLKNLQTFVLLLSFYLVVVYLWLISQKIVLMIVIF